MIHAMLGLGASRPPALKARLTRPLGANGPREHYQRAIVDQDEITVFDRQDSSLLSLLSRANALAISPPRAEAMPTGAEIDYIPL
jgi:molybdopterin molybdotransferase